MSRFENILQFWKVIFASTKTLNGLEIDTETEGRKKWMKAEWEEKVQKNEKQWERKHIKGCFLKQLGIWGTENIEDSRTTLDRNQLRVFVV